MIYGTPNPSTVRQIVRYIIKEQLALPPEKRLLRVPEIDAAQRMHKALSLSGKRGPANLRA